MRTRTAELLSPLQQREGRLLTASHLVSGIGDWAGRLALAVIVFDRTNSALWAAIVIVVSLLPWLGPGQWLATYADRYGRISIMVAADLARAALFLTLLIPMPVAAVIAIAFGAGLFSPPFNAARSAALVDVIDAGRYPHMLALNSMVMQLELIVGYGIGGVVVATLGVDAAVIANAATFIISAALLIPLHDTAANSRHDDIKVGWASVMAGIAVWNADPYCRRALVMFVGIGALGALPEALVVPYTAATDIDRGTIGALVAAGAAGTLVATAVIRNVSGHDELLRSAAKRTIVSATVGAALFAITWAVADTDTATWVTLTAAVAAYFVAGGVDVVAVQTNQVVGQRLPVQGRAAAMAAAGGAMYSTQAAVIGAAGVAATILTVPAVLAGAMIAAAALAAYTLVRPVRSSTDDLTAAEMAAVG